MMIMGLMQLLQISTCLLDKADNTSNSYPSTPVLLGFSFRALI